MRGYGSGLGQLVYATRRSKDRRPFRVLVAGCCSGWASAWARELRAHLDGEPYEYVGGGNG